MFYFILLGEPIWTTAEKNFIKTLVVSWPGSDVKIDLKYPHQFIRFNSSMTLEKKFKLVLDDIDVSDGDNNENKKLYMIYVENIDSIGHKYGPNSNEVYLFN